MFKLVIECSKDISNLSIDFTDGTSVVTETKPQEPRESRESKEIKNKESKSKEPRKPLDEYLNTEEDHSYEQNLVQKPIIENIQRPVKVSEELQNLDL